MWEIKCAKHTSLQAVKAWSHFSSRFTLTSVEVQRINSGVVLDKALEITSVNTDLADVQNTQLLFP